MKSLFTAMLPRRLMRPRNLNLKRLGRNQVATAAGLALVQPG